MVGALLNRLASLCQLFPALGKTDQIDNAFERVPPPVCEHQRPSTSTLILLICFIGMLIFAWDP